MPVPNNFCKLENCCPKAVALYTMLFKSSMFFEEFNLKFLQHMVMGIVTDNS